MRHFREEAPTIVLDLMRSAAKFARKSVPVMWIAEKIGVAPERLRDTIFRLISQDLVESWVDERRRPCLSFTPFAVQTLGIVYRERKLKRRADSWAITEADLWTLTDYERSGITSMDDVEAAGYELHLPEHPDMLQWTDNQRWRAKRADYLAHKIPAPTVLLGERLQWPVPGQETETGVNIATGPCAGCGGHPRDWEFCLICFRYPIAEKMLGIPEPNGKGKRKRAA